MLQSLSELQLCCSRLVGGKVNFAAITRDVKVATVQLASYLEHSDGCFGWKAQNASITMFAGEAYSVEMGISNDLFPISRSDQKTNCVLTIHRSMYLGWTTPCSTTR